MSEKVQSLLRNPPKYPKSCYEPCTRRCNDDCSVYTQHFVEWEQQIRAAIAEENEDKVANALSNKFTYCAYCGKEFEIDAAAEKVSEHIHTCEKHPIADYRERIRILEQQLAEEKADAVEIDEKAMVKEIWEYMTETTARIIVKNLIANKSRWLKIK